MIALEVLGTPAPKGSNRAMVRGGRAVFVPGGSAVNAARLKSWDVAVREAAIGVTAFKHDGGPVFVDTPLVVEIVFRLQRPSGHWHPKGGLRPKFVDALPHKKPDSDKLARSTIDSLTGIVFDDDARIVRLVIDKIYAKPGDEGASITVDRAHAQESAA